MPSSWRNLRAADVRDLGGAAAHAQHVADAPEGEADDQHAEQDEQDDETGVLAEHIRKIHANGEGF